MKLTNKTLKEMDKQENLELLVHKFNVKAPFEELKDVIYSLDDKIGDINCCVWKIMYYDRSSTTFKPVDRNHPTLAKCKYDCLGYV